jgi:class 3 adenylate cyclase/DNA-binding SARP family transcriptional activator
MDFRTLGKLEVVASGETLALGRARQRAVLALLLIQAPEPVPRDRLIDELWRDRPPATASHAVQVHVSALRKLLRTANDGVTLRSSASCYALEVDPDSVDARRFERLIEEGQHRLAEDPSGGRVLLEQALGLWRGTPLADLSQFEFACRERERLEELRGRALECVMGARLASGEHSEVISTLRGLVAADPLREGPRRLLMLALYRCGRHAEALAAYRDACAAVDEVGLLPGPELRALEEAILRHDASLRPPGHDGAKPVGRALESAHRPPDVKRAAGPLPLRRRKIVTVLCCDLAASTPTGAELDPEPLLEAMNAWFAEVRAIVERHVGTVARSIGDAVMAMFGIPRVHEDDALRAVRAAAEIRDRLPAVAEAARAALSFRAAVNTGLVLAGLGEDLTLGSAVNVAARLEQSAEPGEILLDHETLILARDAIEVEAAGALSVTGKSEPMLAFRLLRVDPLAPPAKRHLELRLVGRERELRLLRGAFRRVVQERGCHLFALLGAAGVGKTRLVSELLGLLDDTATVLSGRCLHYGEGITFWPMIEALTPIGAPARPVLERIRTGGVAMPAELFWEVRQLLETVAADRPLILHIDDLQWAEPMLLDLLKHIADLSRTMPILLLCTARPELLEDHPGWVAERLHATTFLMEALDAAACELLLTQLGDDTPQETRKEMIAVSGGNPLFLEEIAGVARERGTVAVPSTIHALLAARLERLEHEERDLLERAAVEGEVFHLDALGEIGGSRAEADVNALLAGLVRKDLVRPHSSQLGDLQTFAFRHLLIRDAAYEGATKETRARLHQRLAGWLETNAPELAELHEIIGWHLEQAVAYRGGLGRADDLGLGTRAAEHLHAAGHRAGQLGDTIAARKLLDRAHDVASPDEPLAARIAVELAEQLIEGGDLARVDSLLSAAEHNPDTASDAALVRLHWLTLTRPHRAPRRIEARLPDMLRQLTAAGDESGLAKAHLAAFWARSQQAVPDRSRCRARAPGGRARAQSRQSGLAIAGARPVHSGARARAEKCRRTDRGARRGRGRRRGAVRGRARHDRARRGQAPRRSPTRGAPAHVRRDRAVQSNAHPHHVGVMPELACLVGAIRRRPQHGACGTARGGRGTGEHRRAQLPLDHPGNHRSGL